MGRFAALLGINDEDEGGTPFGSSTLHEEHIEIVESGAWYACELHESAAQAEGTFGSREVAEPVNLWFSNSLEEAEALKEQTR
jgi:hypothetical protein